MNARRDELVRVPLPAGGALQVYVSTENDQFPLAVVYVHGFGSTRSGVKSLALEQACARRGWTFASFDFRGHGASTGTMLDLRGSALLEDLEFVRDYLVGRGVGELCLVGSSMGGWAAAWFALRNPARVRACALVAPAFHFPRSRWDSLTEAERQRWRESGRLRVRSQWVDTELGFGMMEEIGLFPPERLAAELACPMLIFHGLNDDVVPCAQSLEFVQRAAHPHMEIRIYKDGDHRLLEYKDVMADGACEYFQSVRGS